MKRADGDYTTNRIVLLELLSKINFQDSIKEDQENQIEPHHIIHRTTRARRTTDTQYNTLRENRKRCIHSKGSNKPQTSLSSTDQSVKPHFF